MKDDTVLLEELTRQLIVENQKLSERVEKLERQCALMQQNFTVIEQNLQQLARSGNPGLRTDLYR